MTQCAKLVLTIALLTPLAAFGQKAEPYLSGAQRTKIQAMIDEGILVGGIIMFAGTFGGTSNKFPVSNGTTNTSWHICDGTGGTPNLADKFILGSGSLAVGAMGGTNTVTAAAHTNGTINLNASHIGGSVADYTGVTGRDQNWAVAAGWFVGVYDATRTLHDHSMNHGHTYTPPNDHTNAVFSMNLTHGAVTNLPPYYVLAFIQRIQ